MDKPVGTIFITPRGGLGNTLFIYLNGFSLAQKNSMQLKCIVNYHHQRKIIEKYTFFKQCPFVHITRKLIRNAILIQESSFQYAPIDIPDTARDYILDGYFQSYKYSTDYISMVKQQLFDKQTCDKLRKKVHLENTIALHVRRGDYITLPQHHPVQSEEYYKDALDIVFKKGMKILAFSDDVPYLKTWSLLKKYPYEIINASTEESFLLMTMCNHFIVANSSFSLLAYYFRDHADAKVCFPKKWFGPLGPRYKPEDLISNLNNSHQL